MSELKAHNTKYEQVLGEVYLKSEADKVIAELDESHKKEIGQLLIEIVKLKDSIGKLLKAKTEQVVDEVLQKSLVYGEGFVPVEHAMRLVAELRRNKYKRCLAMAMWCWAVKKLNRYGDQDYMDFAEKWHNRWLAIAEKFKPNSTAQ